jgi:hypothetical protein
MLATGDEEAYSLVIFVNEVAFSLLMNTYQLAGQLAMVPQSFKQQLEQSTEYRTFFAIKKVS